MIWTFWLNVVSPHQSALVRALASMRGHEVIVVAENQLTSARTAIGWQTPDCAPAQTLVAPSKKQIGDLIERTASEQSVHLFGGLRPGTLNREALNEVAKGGAMIGLVSEAGDNRGMMGWARGMMYWADSFATARHVRFILAMGQVGVRFFASRGGYKRTPIFPFGYVTEHRGPVGDSDANPGGVRLLYLGQVISRKDGITAIRALSELTELGWTFKVVGAGPDVELWRETAERLGIEHRVTFAPVVENSRVAEVLGESDLLVLPSRFDGWGAVVNEALMCGVPVVCSDNCGAADLLRESWRGSVFKTGSGESLREALRGWIEGGRPSEAARARIREWSRVIEGPTVAKYLIEVVQCVREGGERPCPPWYWVQRDEENNSDPDRMLSARV